MTEQRPKPPLPLWAAILLAIVLAFVIVGLFGALIYLFTGGAERLGVSTTGQILIFLGVSGIFAWLLKRLSDAASDAGRYWFADEEHGPEDNEPD